MQALLRWMNRGLKYLDLSNSLKTALRSQGPEHLQGIRLNTSTQKEFAKDVWSLVIIIVF